MRSIINLTRLKVPQEWLKTDLTKGLPDSEIENRRNGYGYNELSSPHENQILKFISYFRGPILYVMEIAVVLAAGLQDWIDFGVIVSPFPHSFLLTVSDKDLQIGILMLNAGVGWYQEKQAGDIVEQLKAGIAMKATVVRNGKETQIEARELVAGDIVRFSSFEFAYAVLRKFIGCFGGGKHYSRRRQDPRQLRRQRRLSGTHLLPSCTEGLI